MNRVAPLGLLLGTLLLAGCAAPEQELDDTDVSEAALTSHCAAAREVKLSLPKKKDIVLRAQGCLQYSADGRQVRSWTTLKWEPAGGAGLAIGKKLDKVVVNSTLAEFNEDGDAFPGVDAACDRTATVNDAASGSTTCSTEWRWRRAREWGALNWVDYNVNDDGKGDAWFSLH